MKEKIKYKWNDDIPYNSYTERLKEKYGGRIQKVSVNTRGTCPNKDGSKGMGGCTYCNNDSFVPSYTKKVEDIKDQIDEGLLFTEKRYSKSKMFVAYFQAYTNTYGYFKEIKKQYEDALSHPKIKGLVIGTRPDCVDDYILDYFKELSQEYFFSIEYGMESTYDKTLELINRGHTFEETKNAIFRSKNRGLHTGGHIMLGLPNETKKMMLEQIKKINKLELDTIKVHQLQIIKYTVMAKQYKENSNLFNLFPLDEYIDFIISFLEKLSPNTKIDRLVSESPPNTKVAPNWGENIRVYDINRMIINKMKELKTYQGKSFKNI